MLSELKSQMTYSAIDSDRGAAIRNIETAFAKTLMNEGIKATVSFTHATVGVIVESQDAHDKAKKLLQSIDSMTYTHTDFYEADEDMPAEWYLRYRY